MGEVTIKYSGRMPILNFLAKVDPKDISEKESYSVIMPSWLNTETIELLMRKFERQEALDARLSVVPTNEVITGVFEIHKVINNHSEMNVSFLFVPVSISDRYTIDLLDGK